MHTTSQKKLLSLLLALVFTVGIIPVTAFAATTHTVWFQTDTNRHIRSIVVDHGEPISYISPGSKSGYVFTGWYTDENYMDEWHFDKDTVTKNITLYARWIERENYTSNPYRSENYYNSQYYYQNEQYYDGYYYDGFYRYGDPYSDGEIPVQRDPVEVKGAKDQIYTGKEKIQFTVYGKSKAALLAVVIYPEGDRDKEIVLEKKLDYTLANKGVTVTLTEDLLDSLESGNYEVRIFFPNSQGNAMFTVR